MTITVPAAAALGRTRLTWRAVAGDGHVITANLAEGGAHTNVVE